MATYNYNLAYIISNFVISRFLKNACTKDFFKLQGKLLNVFQDYHVILLLRAADGETLVYDFDTTLEFPCVFDTYIEHAIKQEDNLLEHYRRQET